MERARRVLAVTVVALALLVAILCRRARVGPGIRSGPAPDLALDDAVAEPSPAGNDERTRAPAESEASFALATREATPVLQRRVRIVDAVTSDPVAGALVRRADKEEWEALAPARNPFDSIDYGALFASTKHEATSDSDGFVSVPEGERWIWVAAEYGDRWGMTQVAGTGPVDELLWTTHDRSLAVQVVDGDGAPVAGVPIAVWNASASQDRRWSGRTRSPDGIAVLTHAGAELFAGRFEGEIVARLEFAHVGSSELRAPADPWPEHPLRLVLPPVGSVRVKLVDQNGAPYLGAVRATLGVELLQDGIAGPSAEVSRDGEIAFYPVGLGMRLRLTAFPVGAASWRSKATEFDGPTAAGQEVVTEFRVVNRETTIVGRALDVFGAPLANANLATAECDSDGDCFEPGAARRAVSDENGRFTAAVSPASGASNCPRLRIVAPALALEATLALSSCEAATTVDVGDVCFQASPLIVTGVVENELGAPVSGAYVTVRARSKSYEEDPELAERVRLDEQWRPIALRGTQTAPDGSFVIVGRESDRDLRLLVTKRGFEPTEPIAFERGATEVRIVLRTAFTLRGRLIAPCAAAVGRLAVGTTLTKDPTERIGSLRRPLATGAFTLSDLPQPPLDLVVRLDGSDEPVLRIERIESADDPRLMALSLDELVKCIDIEVRGPDGELVPRFEVRYASAIERSRDEEATGGRVTLVTRADAIDVEVSAAGCASRVLEHVRESVVVHLDRPPVVLLRLRDDAPVPPGDLDYFVWGEQTGLELSPWPSVVFAGKREASLELPRTGAWKLRWYVKNAERNATSWLETDEVTVEFGAEDAVVTLDRPAEEIARRFARLRK